MPDTITITDDRTGKTVTVPITGGVFPSSALRELDPSLFMYDPAYLSTAACRSEITYLDGDAVPDPARRQVAHPRLGVGLGDPLHLHAPERVREVVVLGARHRVG